MDLGVAGRGGARRRTRRRANRRADAAASAQAVPQQQAVPEPVAPAQGSMSDVEQLEKLGQLRDQGVLTEEEFQAKKKQILGL